MISKDLRSKGSENYVMNTRHVTPLHCLIKRTERYDIPYMPIITPGDVGQEQEHNQPHSDIFAMRLMRVTVEAHTVVSFTFCEEKFTVQASEIQN